MKKIFILATLGATVILSGFSSCGFDDGEDLYPYTSALFIYQDYNRNIIVGEGLKIDAGITFSGTLDNREDRIVEYVIDPALITATGKSALPQSYYTLGHPSQIVVPKGELKGYLRIDMDSVAFLSDPKSLTGEYVLPLRLVASPNVDSLPPELSYIRMSVSYYAKQHGYYNYSGAVTKTKDGAVTVVNYTNIPTETNSIRFLETAGPTSFAVIADARNSDDPAKDYGFLLGVPVSGSGAVTLSPRPGSSVEVHPDGNCTYDAANKTFRLSYTYTLTDGTVCTVSEELVFRNRIRDVQDNGLYINEWRGF